MPPLVFAFERDPDDTFRFAPIVDRSVATNGIEFTCVEEEVQSLTARLLAGECDVAVAPLPIYAAVADRYRPLTVGFTVGDGARVAAERLELLGERDAEGAIEIEADDWVELAPTDAPLPPHVRALVTLGTAIVGLDVTTPRGRVTVIGSQSVVTDRWIATGGTPRLMAAALGSPDPERTADAIRLARPGGGHAHSPIPAVSARPAPALSASASPISAAPSMAIFSSSALETFDMIELWASVLPRKSE